MPFFILVLHQVARYPKQKWRYKIIEFYSLYVYLKLTAIWWRRDIYQILQSCTPFFAQRFTTYSSTGEDLDIYYLSCYSRRGKCSLQKLYVVAYKTKHRSPRKKDPGVGEIKQIIINSPPVFRLLPMAYFNCMCIQESNLRLPVSLTLAVIYANLS